MTQVRHAERHRRIERFCAGIFSDKKAIRRCVPYLKIDIEMKIGQFVARARRSAARNLRAVVYLGLYRKYGRFTMAPFPYFWRNMLLVNERRHVKGCVIECGVWRGGMSAGIAEVLGPGRQYFLFDSFEGLPPATELDGESAKAWQSDTKSASYFDNCRAPIEFAEEAMRLSGASDYKLIKGWFEDSLLNFVPPSPIAILRLDGDWYESTMAVLEALFKHLARDGIVIVDDYYAWDGCSRAVHDFLSRHKLTARITQQFGICVLEPRPSGQNGPLACETKPHA
jgi:O-methyltransferase